MERTTFLVARPGCWKEFLICEACWAEGDNDEAWNELITQRILARQSVNAGEVKLHVYRFDCTDDWFVGATPEQAIEEWRSEHEEYPEEDADYGTPEPRQEPNDGCFDLGGSDGEDIESKTFAEWARERGVGFLGREL